MIIDLLLLSTILCPIAGEARTQDVINNWQEVPITESVFEDETKMTWDLAEDYEFLLEEESKEVAIATILKEHLEGKNYRYGGFDINWDELVTLLSLNPIQLLKAKQVTEKAVEMTNTLYPNQGNYQDDGDAFRHTYWSALLTRSFGDDFAISLTSAHESGEPDGIDKDMDLHNNSNGVLLYHEWLNKINYSGDYPQDDIAYFVAHCIANGEIYDCVKINASLQKIVYTNVGYNNTSSYGMKGYIDTIDVDDWTFPQQYHFYPAVKDAYTNNSVLLETNRLRTGYIEQEYIVLSPRRADAGYAYLDVFFPTPIVAVDLDMCLWSEYEYYDPSNCNIFVGRKINYNSHVMYYDLLNDYSLSTNRTNPNRFRFNFPDGTTGIRFAAQAPAVGDRNKGRVCIGQMDIIFANTSY